MPKYIDKSAIIAEIERRKQDAINNCGGFKSMREHECDSCIVWQYEEMEDIINTLEVKEVDLITHTVIAECCDWLAMNTKLNHDKIEDCRNSMLAIKDERLKT